MRYFSQVYQLPLKVVEKIGAFVYNVRLEKLFLMDTLDVSREKYFESCIQKVASGYPVEYLIQKTNFYGLDFYVNEHVLIPRDDTEILVERAKEYIETLSTHTYLFDIGTGSGCIPLALFHNIGYKIQQCFVFEISHEALDVAKKNIHTLSDSSKFQCFAKDFNTIPKIFPQLGLDDTKPIVITANLPYIQVGDPDLCTRVLMYEPKKALFGGMETGFELYQHFFEILLSLPQKYRSKMTVFIEIGYQQGDTARHFFRQKNLNFEIFRDTHECERVIKIDFFQNYP